MESGTLTDEQVKIYREAMVLPIATIIAKCVKSAANPNLFETPALIQVTDTLEELIKVVMGRANPPSAMDLAGMTGVQLSAAVWGDWIRTLTRLQHINVALWVAGEKAITDVAETGVDVFHMAQLASMCDIINADGEPGIYKESCVIGMALALTELKGDE